ncbi:LacI family DNA-binding transcriptional regulator [Curvibacter sp. RS43]|uniref:LacI family DNA-binding transcriptional regulator n=1 Tax=Curvibacter microcysteis TaxID=3026419 RepID=UPI00236177D6|nr:LacI family DNA-binding transcriptional regulator [Curvibacter sp. RS43]MDD0810299.1 LacI family DNA-binding transcriptional regulator [Curvibacter sp. RS43]
MATTAPPNPAPTPKRARRGSGAVTLHDVARLAAVAPITASRALNTPEQVSPEVRQRVTEAVAALGYVRNHQAGALASARSRLVAAVVPTLSGPVFGPMLQALTEALAERGYQLMLGQSGYVDSREDALLDAIIGRRPDGIVLTGVERSPEARRRLLASGIPVVETWDLTPAPLDLLVGFSHADVGHAVAQFLVQRGRRQLAVVAGDDERSRRRERAFCQAAAEAGLPAVRVIRVPAPTTLKRGRQALCQLCESGPAVEAVFCSSDLLALGVLTEAQARGLAVPAALAVVGFGDQDFAADLNPALSSVRIDGQAMGRQAAQFVVDRAEGRDIPERVVDLGFSLIERGST